MPHLRALCLTLLQQGVSSAGGADWTYVQNYADAKAEVVAAIMACACRKSNPNILVVQPAQDRAAKNGPGWFDGARDRRILLQR
jgi:hypothetical protein